MPPARPTRRTACTAASTIVDHLEHRSIAMHHRSVLRRGLNVALAACAFAIASALLPPVVPDAHAGGGGSGGGGGGGGGGGNEMALRDPDYKAAMDAVKK